MDTVAFSSLLIGLIVGLQPIRVELAKAAHAAAIVFSLDGRSVATAKAPPWQVVIDFGQELRPHEVVAVALDSRGQEVGRASCLVNVPQAPASLQILIDHDARGRPESVRLVATSVIRSKPARQTLTLDGITLPLESDGRARIPKVDLAQPHVLSGAAEFSESIVVRTDVVFGGDVADLSGSRLTAVPIRLTTSPAPTAESLRGLVSHSGVLVEPAAIEKGPATVLVVRSPSNQEAERHLGSDAPAFRFPAKLDGADRFGFIWPVVNAADQADLFEAPPLFSARDGSFFWLLTRVYRAGSADPPYRFADAVAVAGRSACASGGRRAVVLVQGEERNDTSRFSPDQVRSYLFRLGVPLFVWTLTCPADDQWAAPEDISTFGALEKAVGRLKKELDSQRIVWIAGEWAPGQIELSTSASGIELAR